MVPSSTHNGLNDWPSNHTKLGRGTIEQVCFTLLTFTFLAYSVK